MIRKASPKNSLETVSDMSDLRTALGTINRNFISIQRTLNEIRDRIDQIERK